MERAWLAWSGWEEAQNRKPPFWAWVTAMEGAPTLPQVTRTCADVAAPPRVPHEHPQPRLMQPRLNTNASEFCNLFLGLTARKNWPENLM